jgi:adenosine deaminase
MVRTGLEHIFLPGESLWREADTFSRTAAACAADAPSAGKPSAACADYLKSSEKAQQQWELERRFREFEAGF